MDKFKSRLETEQVQFKIPWDKVTARAFGLSLALHLLISWIIPYLELKFDPPRLVEPPKTIPIEILSFGNGDGTGLSHGNLTEEGMAHKGEKPNNPLEDAKISSKTKSGKPSDLTIEQSNAIKAVSALTSDQKSGSVYGSDNRNIGKPDGSDLGSGLGNRGSGKGAGVGLGDIDWGGGGNRLVLQKIMPSYPKGAYTKGSIKVKFYVLPDGTVSSAFPIQKCDPALEKSAIDALKKWRFNKVSGNIQVGTIVFTYNLK